MPHLWGASPAYPAPRTRRGAAVQAGPSGELPPIPAPTTRLWPFNVQEAGPGRVTVVSPFFRGPAVVTEAWLRGEVGSGTPGAVLTILYAADQAGAGNSQASTALPSGTSLWESRSLQREDGASFAAGDGIFDGAGNPGGNSEGIVHRIGAVVPLNDFALKVSMFWPQAAAVGLSGYVRLLESVDPELLPDLLA